jgi:protein O-mannosyl-transferase
MPRRLLICGCLAALTAAAYWRVGTLGFVDIDDPGYVTENRHVRQGLSWEGAKWAFTSFRQCGNWHPLTWLSHMLDVRLFTRVEGPGPQSPSQQPAPPQKVLWSGGPHLVNLALHTANTWVLFLLLAAMTGSLWRSAVVAALFAVHPLHVESVAWVAERKDVLSTLFGLLAIAAYVGYARRPGAARYLLVAGLLAVGLMAKPMLVTLPCLFLLLDYWPLGRLWPSSQGGGGTRSSSHPTGTPAAAAVSGRKRPEQPKMPRAARAGKVDKAVAPVPSDGWCWRSCRSWFLCYFRASPPTSPRQGAGRWRPWNVSHSGRGSPTP